MHTSRKATQEASEKALRHKIRRDALLADELHDDKLTQLLAFVRRLKETPPGNADLELRTRLFGECRRNEGEPSGQFYGRLRHWLDRDFPQAKTSRKALRRTDD